MIDLDKERITDKMDDLEQCLIELEEYLPEGVDEYLGSCDANTATGEITLIQIQTQPMKYLWR